MATESNVAADLFIHDELMVEIGRLTSATELGTDFIEDLIEHFEKIGLHDLASQSRLAVEIIRATRRGDMEQLRELWAEYTKPITAAQPAAAEA